MSVVPRHRQGRHAQTPGGLFHLSDPLLEMTREIRQWTLVILDVNRGVLDPPSLPRQMVNFTGEAHRKSTFLTENDQNSIVATF